VVKNLLELAPAEPHRFRELLVAEPREQVVSSRMETNLEIRLGERSKGVCS
jgi:hypothetical protein